MVPPLGAFRRCPLTCNPKLVALTHHHCDDVVVAAATDDGMHIRAALSKPVAPSKLFDALMQLLAVSFHRQGANVESLGGLVTMALQRVRGA